MYHLTKVPQNWGNPSFAPELFVMRFPKSNKIKNPIIPKGSVHM